MRITLTCKKLANHLKGRGIRTRIAWICAHAGLSLNEIAKREAKSAAEATLKEDNPLTVTEAGAKSRIRQHLSEKWQDWWDKGQTARLLHDFIPKVNSRPQTRHLPRVAETQINQVRSSFSKLNDHLYLHGKLVEFPSSLNAE